MLIRKEIFTKEYLDEAMDFAKYNINNYYFKHFTHTMPDKMLGNDWLVVMILDDNKLISWNQAQLFNTSNKKHIARLGFITDEEYRNKGLATYGLRSLEKELKQIGIEKLTATTNYDNKPMLKVFLRNNFVIEGLFINEEKHFGGETRHVISLAKYIIPPINISEEFIAFTYLYKIITLNILNTDGELIEREYTQ